MPICHLKLSLTLRFQIGTSKFRYMIPARRPSLVSYGERGAPVLLIPWHRCTSEGTGLRSILSRRSTKSLSRLSSSFSQRPEPPRAGACASGHEQHALRLLPPARPRHGPPMALARSTSRCLGTRARVFATAAAAYARAAFALASPGRSRQHASSPGTPGVGIPAGRLQTLPIPRAASSPNPSHVPERPRAHSRRPRSPCTPTSRLLLATEPQSRRPSRTSRSATRKDTGRAHARYRAERPAAPSSLACRLLPADTPATCFLAVASSSPYHHTRYSQGCISPADTSRMSRSFSASVSWTMLSSCTTPTHPSSGIVSPMARAQAITARLTSTSGACSAFSCLRTFRIRALLSLDTSVAVRTCPTLSRSNHRAHRGRQPRSRQEGGVTIVYDDGFRQLSFPRVAFGYPREPRPTPTFATLPDWRCDL